MSGLHKDGLGWNACGVFCGECGCDTCEGCHNEYTPWSGLSEEAIERIRNKVSEEGLTMAEYIERECRENGR